MKLLTNPRFAILLVVFMVGFGLKSAADMPKELYPDLEIPIAMVVAVYPGAPPEMVEVRVTNVLERYYKTLPRLTKLKSSSIESASIILLEFDPDADMAQTFRALEDKTTTAREDLPSEVESVTVKQASVTNAPVVTLNLITDIDPREAMKVAKVVQDRLEAIEGVSEVRVSGLRDDQVQVLLNRHRMDDIGASLNDVSFSIQGAEQDAPLGRVQTERRNYPLQVRRLGLDLERLRQLPVRSSSTGETVLLADIAVVKRALSEQEQFARFVQLGPDGRTADTVTFDVLRQPGANLIEIGLAVRAVAEDLQRNSLPPDAELVVTMDQSIEIRDNIRLLVTNGFQAVLLVFAVLFFFLGVKESIVAGLSIPLTFLTTMIVLKLLGYSINSLSLMALVIALGLLVDDFILVMEGMHDGIHKGMKPSEAALYTLKTYGAASISGSLTTIAAFLPMAFLQGINGKFVRVVPVTVAVTLLISYGISMTVDLAAGASWFKKAEANILTRTTDRLLRGLSEYYYQNITSRAFGTRWKQSLAVAISAVLFLVGAYLFSFTEQVLYPDIDAQTIGATLYLPAGANLDQTRALADKVETMLRGESDYVEHFIITAGQMSSLAFTSPEAFLEPFRGEHILGISVELKPEEERDLKSYQYAKVLRRKLEAIHPGRLEIHEKRMSPTGGAPVEVMVSGPDPARVDAMAETLRLMMLDIPELTGVRDNRKEHSGGFRIELDDEALKHNNLSRTEALMFLRSAIDGKEAATVVEDDKEIKIMVGYDWRDDGQWNSPSSLEELEALKVSGMFSFSPVPLAALGDFKLNTSPYGVSHNDRRYAVTLAAENRSGSPVEIGKRLEKMIQKKFHLEPGERIMVLGDKAKNEEAQGELRTALAIAVALIFSILVMQFGSFKQPFIIMTALPLSMVGVFYGFASLDLAFSFPAMVGLVSLAGIVVNDAIVLIDTINRYRRKGFDPVDACRTAGRDRLRPILSTTITTITGLLPLAFTDPVWQGMCLTIVFGISLATILTLVVVPALYLLIAQNDVIE